MVGAPVALAALSRFAVTLRLAKVAKQGRATWALEHRTGDQAVQERKVILVPSLAAAAPPSEPGLQ